MAATGSSNRGEQWDCFIEEHQVNIFVWGPESLDCHTYFGVVHLTREAPPGFESTPIGRLLAESDITTMFVENAPLCGFTDVEYRRVALAVADILTPETLVLQDWIHGRITLVTPETASLLRGPEPQLAFEGGIALGRSKP